MFRSVATFAFAFMFLAAGCIIVIDEREPRVSGTLAVDTTAETRAVVSAETAKRLEEHIRVLSSDEFEGRAPGTASETKTIDYLTEQFRAVGALPGNPDGSYVQKVPLVGLRSTASGSFRVKEQSIALEFPKDCVALTKRFVPDVHVDASEMVFVGYGVVAPEYGWDDYKDVDVRGKTIVMLVGDPAVADSTDPTRLDDRMFGGRAMTYYGRWTYKYEIAAEKGAAAAVIVHETGPAGYGWGVVEGSFGRENFDIEAAGGNAGRAAVESWIHLDKAKELLQACGHDFDALKQKALSKDFRPVALGAQASFAIANDVRRIDSHNFVARVQGVDAAVADELIVYCGHWDHLGKIEVADGDGIYNGAVDNASGIAALIEIAASFSKGAEKPRRSVLFLALTAEEKGLLGSKHYAAHPLYPLEKTLAVLNMDSMNVWGKTRDIVSIGRGSSTLDEVLDAAAGARGRVVMPDPEPEKGLFYRSDHFEFAKRGVPAMYADSGVDVIGKPAGWGQKMRDEYTANDYHKPSDEMTTDWDLSGTAEDVELLIDVGLRIARDDKWPEWKPGSEFKARREAMLKN
jgi:Zn-dependent M28 family amino/carboxypeptidase